MRTSIAAVVVFSLLVGTNADLQAEKGYEGGACGTIPFGYDGDNDPWHGGTGSTFQISGYVGYQSNLHAWDSDGTIGGTGHETCV